jgi:hypothetical protein
MLPDINAEERDQPFRRQKGVLVLGRRKLDPLGGRIVSLQNTLTYQTIIPMYQPAPS